jgi:hypothetical protein
MWSTAQEAAQDGKSDQGLAKAAEQEEGSDTNGRGYG